MSKYEDWADWAGDNSQQAEADLRAERERNERWAEHKRLAERSTIPDRDGAESAALYAKERREREALAVCGHTEAYSNGHCADCGVPIEDFEPSDAQIPGTYEIRKAAA